MRWLNELNGANELEHRYSMRCLKDFEGQLYGVIMGIAYGGGVEQVAKNWKERGGIIYGLDTFEDLHPKQLAVDQDDIEATCMNQWYEQLGTETLSYDYQRKTLNSEGLTNAILVKGLVKPDSCQDIPYLNYAFLDMDMIASMKTGYAAVADKIVPGGYLLLHDVIECLPLLMKWYISDIRPYWHVIEERHLTAVLQKHEQYPAPYKEFSSPTVNL